MTSRQQLSNQDKRQIGESLEGQYHKEFLTKKDIVEILEQGNFKVLVINKVVSFFWHGDADGHWVPTLRLLLKGNVLPKAVVDMGAVRFVASGADVMRPGIKTMDPCAAGSIISVVDEQHGKPLAIGKALVSSEELLAQTKGKSIESLHHVGDALWNLQEP